MFFCGIIWKYVIMVIFCKICYIVWIRYNGVFYSYVDFIYRVIVGEGF